MAPTRCYYEVLNVERSASNDDLKKAYRRLALSHHPDKNIDNPQAAKETFQEIQLAYETLSDPNDRAWYDDHREAILGKTGNSENDLNLFPYFSSTCFDGYEETKDNNFFSVYRNLFYNIYIEDKEIDCEMEEYPSFGRYTSSVEDWQNFYSFFSGYCTSRSYSWFDKYDTRQAENRRIKRLMEKDNKKIRDEAKKERNEIVRKLTGILKKRDPRVRDHNIYLKEKAASNAQKTKDWQIKQLQERADLLKIAEDSTFKSNELEKELQCLEEQYDSEEDEKLNYCELCDKKLRNFKNREKHFSSKQHMENVMLLECLNKDNSEENEIVVNEENVVREEENTSNEKELLSKTKKLKKKRKKQKDDSESLFNSQNSCAVCLQTFTSKNMLFSHLKESNHSVPIDKMKK